MATNYFDYLEHYNHNHDKLGRFATTAGGAASLVGGKVTGKSKKKQPPKPNVKKGKAANTKLSESERNRIVKSGSAKEVNARKSQLSNKELESAIKRLSEEQVNRANLEQQLSSLASPKNQSKINKAVKWMEQNQNTLKTIADWSDQAIRVYNNYAKINNALNSSSKMPTVTDNKFKSPKVKNKSGGKKKK